MRKATLPADVHFAWGKTLSPVRAAVVLASIAEAAGSSDAAFQLLIRAMPYHLKANLHDDPAMPKHLGMIAATLIDACHVEEELSAGTFEGGNAALTVLSASVKGKPLVDAENLALRAQALALCGEAPHADAAASPLSRHRARSSRPRFAPTRSARWRAPGRSTSAGARAYVEALRQTYELMLDWGDEPRRARVGGLLARFLAETGQPGEAAEILVDCQRISKRLNLPLTGNELVAVGGRLYLAEGRPRQGAERARLGVPALRGRPAQPAPGGNPAAPVRGRGRGGKRRRARPGRLGSTAAAARPGHGPAARGEQGAPAVRARPVRRGPRPSSADLVGSASAGTATRGSRPWPTASSSRSPRPRRARARPPSATAEAAGRQAEPPGKG